MSRSPHKTLLPIIWLILAQEGQPISQPAGAPPPFQDETAQRCVEEMTAAGEACSIEWDTISLIYPRGSDYYPTEDEIIRSITRMRSSSMPSPSCCTALAPAIKDACPCNTLYQQLFPSVGFSAIYVEGVTAIVALACRLNVQACPQDVASSAGPGK